MPFGLGTAVSKCISPPPSIFLKPLQTWQKTLSVWREGMEALASAGPHVYLKVRGNALKADTAS
jgi:hypothetical protein